MTEADAPQLAELTPTPELLEAARMAVEALPSRSFNREHTDEMAAHLARDFDCFLTAALAAERDRTIEECALLCECFAYDNPPLESASDAGYRLRDCIRALKAATPTEETPP